MPIHTESGLKLTYEDYIKIPEDGLRHEIIDGREIVTPAPRSDHQIILYRLGLALQSLEHSGQAQVIPSPIDVQLTEIDIVQPDLIAIAHANLKRIGELKIEGPPDLVIEILSPKTRRKDRGEKRALYEATGVREYWIVDLEQKTLCQHTLVGDRYEETPHTAGTLESTAFPGTSVSLVELFATSDRKSRGRATPEPEHPGETPRPVRRLAACGDRPSPGAEPGCARAGRRKR